MSERARAFRQAVSHVVDRILEKRRLGFYVATVDRVSELRTTRVVPEWADDLSIRGARRISSPLLDVVPAVGTRMAVASLDGVVEVPGILGAIFDDLSEETSAWIRADLETLPGHVEIGGETSVSIYVGPNPGLEGHSSPGPGKIRIGSDVVDLLDIVNDILTVLATTGVTASGATVEPALATIGASLNGSLPDIIARLATIKA